VWKSRIFGLIGILGLSLPGAAGAELPVGLGHIDGKVVYVDFWASWCVPCRKSFPWMNEMIARYGDQGLQIIGVNLDKQRKLANGFLAETPAKFDIRFDPAGTLAKLFKVEAMPSSFLLDAQGNVITSHFGFRTGDTDDYEAAIRAALGAAAKDGTR
jgi:thiol-disulfide isomerase/thioredoxin